ncbi:hypothetical protein BV25DRAFT_821259 [Artomyces pyxidatus]|uniref:Uncharacterized protein n=1 Tax=Artomyces pyxidatus TaxID=48021 RepID=A0ACB8SXM3_9AGAM|nr:hypothetical protein BV25DRAFT_821259 [Artomyces pyxidatus]
MSYQQPGAHVPRPDPFLDGYISNMFGPNGAEFYFSCLLKVPARSLNAVNNIHNWPGAYFVTHAPSPNPQPQAVIQQQYLFLLDYAVMSGLGTVVPQTIWIPSTQQDWVRHVRDAILEMPIFFVHNDGALGISVVNASAGNSLTLRGINNELRIGPSRTQAQLRMNWPGYPEQSRRISMHQPPLTLFKWVRHIGRAVDAALQEYSTLHNQSYPQWAVHAGGITRNEVLIIGVIQVSAGSWMPILQISRHIL